MVFFSCDGCGEMLKKNQVDNHARKCWNCESVSCVDCSVSFWGDDYKQHTTCLTEAERYEKTVYKGPKKHDKCNRKFTPQEAWMEIIVECAEKCPKSLSSHLQQISTLDNVPRKEKAFRNFASNSLRLRDPQSKIVSDIWNHISSFRQQKLDMKAKAEQEKSKCGESQVQSDHTPLKQEQAKQPSSSDKDDEQKDEPLPSDSGSTAAKSKSTKVLKKKKALKIVKKALKKATKHQLKMKELKKILKGRIKEEDLKVEGDSSISKMLLDTVESNGTELRLDEGKIVTLII